MGARISHRLPGFRFETQSSPLTDVLPRMDVAVFVGFAAAGPLHRPVAVEDAAQFRAIFGDDIPLAWDQQRNVAMYACLAPTIRAFFRNGGRRCWIVRVAAPTARYNYFPIAGLVAVDADGKITPAFARARSEGSWSDSWQVSATLTNMPVTLIQFAPDGLSLELALASSSDVAVGDLVRLDFIEAQASLFFLVQTQQIIEPAISATPSTRQEQRMHVKVTSDATNVFWFPNVVLPDSLPAIQQAVMFDHTGQETLLTISALSHTEDTLTLEVSGISLAQTPTIGSLIRVDFSDVPSLFLHVHQVDEQQVIAQPASSASSIVRIRGQKMWRKQALPTTLPVSPTVTRLSFELWARQDNDYPVRLRNLAFSSIHPRSWQALPTDERLFQFIDATGETTPISLWQAERDSLHEVLWREAATPRFPLAGDGSTATRFLPIGMAAMPEQFLGPEVTTPRMTPLERDGLAHFNTTLFLDEELASVYTPDLLTTANFVRYESNDIPRQLKGVHAAFNIEEATIIAVPDAIQRGWLPDDEQQVPPPPQSKPLQRPTWWHFLDCTTSPPSSLHKATEPQWSNFLDATIRVLPPPHITLLKEADEHGSFTLGWTTLQEANTHYILQEATFPDEDEFVTIYSGLLHEITLYGRRHGNYYYRVQAEVGNNLSDWSEGCVVQVTTTPRYRLLKLAEYRPDTLLDVQRALLRLCAVRGDLCAILSLPEHYYEHEAISHVAILGASTHKPHKLRELAGGVPPLHNGEQHILSYGTLYHPWLICQDDINPGILRSIPADGAISGLWARRTLARGAWIAPANEPLSGVVALTPRIEPTSWQSLQDAQINLLRQEARGFLTLSADTLSSKEESDLRPLNVRRLLILLRRMALRLGATYVFEPHSDAFRRLVQRGFEQMLAQMFMRGAFAGTTTGNSYQVVIDSTLNTSRSIEQGRFIVELRVAPSLPLTFLTLRLLQEGTRGTVTEGR